jgi:hypothetical protein
MLDVYITVDTEVSTYGPRWQASAIEEDVERDIYGATPEGRFGIEYQIEMLNRHGLKAVFFVEALFADVAGPEPLARMVRVIREGGHDVQLHLHTEWLENMSPETSPLPGRTGANMHDFSEEEQLRLLARGVENLKRCGAEKVNAFRAGNYGANWDTLRAMARAGLLFDSSYNECYLDGTCAMRGSQLLRQPLYTCGVHEFPVSIYRDYPGHFRHAQICACSSQEMEHALQTAWKQGWTSFVIVSHSFELIRRARQSGERSAVDPVVTARFERLCRFLAARRDRFRTATFAELSPDDVITGSPSDVLPGRLWNTPVRVGEQIYRKFLAAGGRQ